MRPQGLTMLALLTACAGCTWGPMGVDALRFACSAATDCAEGNVCREGECVAGTVERNCANGVDDDDDGQPDCADPDCAGRACSGTSPGHVCCDLQCVDLSTDERHCGGCSLVCALQCEPWSEGEFTSGGCTCSSADQCPSGQRCHQGRCGCSSDEDCGPEGVCSARRGPVGACRPR